MKYVDCSDSSIKRPVGWVLDEKCCVVSVILVSAYDNNTDGQAAKYHDLVNYQIEYHRCNYTALAWRTPEFVKKDAEICEKVCEERWVLQTTDSYSALNAA